MLCLTSWHWWGFRIQFIPENKWRHAIHSNELALCVAVSVDSLFARSIAAVTKSHIDNGAVFEVRIDSKSSVHIPKNDGKAVCGCCTMSLLSQVSDRKTIEHNNLHQSS